MLRGFQEVHPRASGAHRLLRETRKSIQFDHSLASADLQFDNMPRWLPNTFGERLTNQYIQHPNHYLYSEKKNNPLIIQTYHSY